MIYDLICIRWRTIIVILAKIKYFHSLRRWPFETLWCELLWKYYIIFVKSKTNILVMSNDEDYVWTQWPTRWTETPGSFGEMKRKFVSENCFRIKIADFEMMSGKNCLFDYYNYCSDYIHEWQSRGFGGLPAHWPLQVCEWDFVVFIQGNGRWYLLCSAVFPYPATVWRVCCCCCCCWRLWWWCWWSWGTPGSSLKLVRL